MIFIGISVSHAGLRNIAFRKDNILVLLGRFFFAPLLMMILVIPSNMPLLMKQVFILQSAMPVMTNAPVVASLYGGADADYAAVMVTETTLISLVMVPLLMMVTQSL